MEKIKLNRKHRLKEINKLALLIEDEDLKSLGEAKKIAKTIEILSNDSILEGLNSSIDNFKKGRYTKRSDLEA